MHEDPTVLELRQRVKMLEERLAGVRASRRVLMNLLGTQRDQQSAAVRRLEKETQRLKSKSTRFAKQNWEMNRVIWDLRARLDQTQHEA